MELRALLVPEESVRDPDLPLLVDAQSNLGKLGVWWSIAQPRVSPRLPEVDVHLVILHSAIIIITLVTQSSYAFIDLHAKDMGFLNPLKGRAEMSTSYTSPSRSKLHV